MPLATLLLILANFAAYRLELASGGMPACEAYGLIPAHFSLAGTVTPAFTAMFLHDPVSLGHLLGNMVALLIFGSVVEEALGGLAFLGIYFGSGLAGAFAHVLVNPSSVDPLVGASGAISGILAVAAIINPRLIGFVVAFAVVNIWHAFGGSADGVSFACHIGGFVAGVVVAVVLRAVGSEALEAA